MLQVTSMRSITALCLLAGLCTVHANPLDILRQGIERSKNEVRDTITKLERLRSKTEYDTISESMQYLSNQKMLFINYSDRMIKVIKNNTEAAKAKGKNAQPCYDNAFNLFDDIKRTAMKNSDQCVETAKSSINIKLGFIESLISVGSQLIAELDNIFPNCFSSNIFQMQQCVALRLGSNNQIVKKWSIEASRADEEAAIAFRDVSKQSHLCIFNVLKVASNQITEAFSAASTCINNS